MIQKNEAGTYIVPAVAAPLPVVGHAIHEYYPLPGTAIVSEYNMNGDLVATWRKDGHDKKWREITPR